MARDRTSIEQILENEGPLLSSRLCSILEGRGLSRAAARQRISRANGEFDDVKRLHGLVFPRGVRFLYHRSAFGSDQYWSALLRDIGEASPAYAAAIAALQARGGIVPRAHWDIISGSPVRQKGQIASETVLERLSKVQLLELVDVHGVGPCVQAGANGFLGSAAVSELKARLVAEKILLLAVKEWARQLGVASYDKVLLRDDPGGPPKVGTMLWDATGPSYLRPLLRRDGEGKPKPGFLVCDVIIGDGDMSEQAVRAFLRKCQLLAAFKRMGPLLPVLIADRYSREGFTLGRSQGIMMATPASLFGRNVADGLAALLHTLTKAAAIAAQRPEVVGGLFDKLGAIEGAAANLRGALFEMLVGHCVMKIDDGSIDIGKTIIDPDTAKSTEIDVFRVKEYREVWSYECKAHQPTEIVSRDAVEHWVTNRVPLMHRTLSREQRFQQCAFHYEYWTCGLFEPDALTFLREAAGRTKRYAIGWKDRDAVRAYVARVKPKAVAQMFDQHFFRHPIAIFEKRNSRASDSADQELVLLNRVER
jgi:hypothetical protein